MQFLCLFAHAREYPCKKKKECMDNSVTIILPKLLSLTICIVYAFWDFFFHWTDINFILIGVTFNSKIHSWLRIATTTTNHVHSFHSSKSLVWSLDNGPKHEFRIAKKKKQQRSPNKLSKRFHQRFFFYQIGCVITTHLQFCFLFFFCWLRTQSYLIRQKPLNDITKWSFKIKQTK